MPISTMKILEQGRGEMIQPYDLEAFREWNRTEKPRTLIDKLITGPFFISNIELNDRGEIYAADRTVGRHGIRIFRADDGVELTSAPLNLVLPPFDIVFLR